jgi:excisionase family DNA binding protein
MGTEARGSGAVEPQWGRPAYVAQRYGIALGTLYDMCEAGTIPSSRVGRGLYIRLADMDELMARSRVQRGEKAAS